MYEILIGWANFWVTLRHTEWIDEETGRTHLVDTLLSGVTFDDDDAHIIQTE